MSSLIKLSVLGVDVNGLINAIARGKGLMVESARSGSSGCCELTLREVVQAEPAPLGWVKGDLPPVRTVCDYKHVHEWQKVEVFAVKPNYNGSHTALFIYENGCWGACAEPSSFRPVRTPEQIAQETREDKARAMHAEIFYTEPEDIWDHLPEGTRETFRVAIDNGWQKVDRS